jgi:hypothetical protein
VQVIVMRIKVVSSAAVVLLITLAMTGRAGTDQAPVPDSPFVAPPVEVAAPAPEGASLPFLATDARGRVWLSWLEPKTGGGHRFRLARWQNGAWSEARTIAEGDNFFANWADVPSIFVTSTGTLAAHWLQRGGGRGTYDYGVRVRTSSDEGRTWTPVAVPHKDASPTEHGFVSFFEGAGSEPGLIWLDGRASAGHASGGHGGAMSLRSTALKHGVPGEDVLVDDRVCDCCPTTAVRTASGVLVAYRDRSDGDIRDISVSRLSGGAWTKPARVNADDWQINGCPVNGPSLAAAGKSVVVGWFTSAGGTSRVRVAFSTDNGVTFGAPADVPAATTLGRVAVAMPGAGRALVSSLERLADGAALVVREARADGKIGAMVRVAPMSAERTSGFARVAISGRQAIFAWTDARRGAPSRVKVAVARLR